MTCFRIPALTGIDGVLSSMHTHFPVLQQHLRSALHDRFQDLICSDEYVLATLLDCRYKLIPFTDDSHMLTQNHSAKLKTVTRAEAKLCLSRAFARTKQQMVNAQLIGINQVSGTANISLTPSGDNATTSTAVESVPSIFSIYNDTRHIEGW